MLRVFQNGKGKSAMIELINTLLEEITDLNKRIQALRGYL